VARHYRDILDGFIIDTLDAGQADDIAALGFQVSVGETLMASLQIKQQLAQQCITLIDQINPSVRA
jgi:hypothetical protein